MATRGLPIVDSAAARVQDRQDGVVLSAAQSLLDSGRAADARASLRPLAENPVTAIRAHACLLYAGILLMNGKAQDALEALARLPQRPTFSLDEGYRRMIEACALRQARRYPEALAAARLAVDQGPTPGRLLVLADAQKHAGFVDDAVRTLRDLVARDPGNATALAQLAGYTNLRGDLDEGARIFAAFSALGEHSADADRNAAFYFATRGDVDGTVASLTAALNADPEATRSYIADEVELERFRGDARVAALLR